MVAEAGPGPLLRLFHEAPHHWIAVHVTQLLHTFPFRPHIEIVISRLPERALGSPQRDRQLDRLDYLVQAGAARFVDQQVYMLRHHNAADDCESISSSNSL